MSKIMHKNQPTPYHSILLRPPVNAPVPISYASDPHESLLALSRQTAYLQQKLQSFLDAQSDCLLAGLGRPPPPSEPQTRPLSQTQNLQPYHDDPSEDGSSSYTPETRTSSVSRPTSSPRQTSRSKHQDSKRVTRKREQPSLRATRDGILSTLHRLAKLKLHESSILSTQIVAGSEAREGIDTLLRKKTRIEDKVRGLEVEADIAGGLQSLEVEERGLQEEIRALEALLEEKKGSLRVVSAERAALVSRREAGLASWKGALREVEGMLDREVLGASESQRGWLGKKKRGEVTVDMVRERVNGEVMVLEEKRADVEKEKEACEEGANLWEGCIEAVEAVETRMRREMRKMREAGSGLSTTMPSVSSSPSLRSDKDASDKDTLRDNRSIDPTESILATLSTAVEALDVQLKIADDNDWKFLVCCIGAELEAMKEASTMLQATVSQTASFMTALDGEKSAGRSKVLDPLATSQIAQSEIESLVDDKVPASGEGPSQARRPVEPSEDEDDEPGSDLLISRLNED